MQSKPWVVASKRSDCEIAKTAESCRLELADWSVHRFCRGDLSLLASGVTSHAFDVGTVVISLPSPNELARRRSVSVSVDSMAVGRDFPTGLGFTERLSVFGAASPRGDRNRSELGLAVGLLIRSDECSG